MCISIFLSALVLHGLHMVFILCQWIQHTSVHVPSRILFGRRIFTIKHFNLPNSKNLLYFIFTGCRTYYKNIPLGWLKGNIFLRQTYNWEMATVDVFVGNFTVIDTDLYELWLSGFSGLLFIHCIPSTFKMFIYICIEASLIRIPLIQIIQLTRHMFGNQSAMLSLYMYWKLLTYPNSQLGKGCFPDKWRSTVYQFIKILNYC